MQIILYKSIMFVIIEKCVFRYNWSSWPIFCLFPGYWHFSSKIIFQKYFWKFWHLYSDDLLLTATFLTCLLTDSFEGLFDLKIRQRNLIDCLKVLRQWKELKNFLVFFGDHNLLDLYLVTNHFQLSFSSAFLLRKGNLYNL